MAISAASRCQVHSPQTFANHSLDTVVPQLVLKRLIGPLEDKTAAISVEGLTNVKAFFQNMITSLVAVLGACEFPYHSASYKTLHDAVCEKLISILPPSSSFASITTCSHFQDLTAAVTTLFQDLQHAVLGNLTWEQGKFIEKRFVNAGDDELYCKSQVSSENLWFVSTDLFKCLKKSVIEDRIGEALVIAGLIPTEANRFPGSDAPYGPGFLMSYGYGYLADYFFARLEITEVLQMLLMIPNSDVAEMNFSSFIRQLLDKDLLEEARTIYAVMPDCERKKEVLRLIQEKTKKCVIL